MRTEVETTFTSDRTERNITYRITSNPKPVVSRQSPSGTTHTILADMFTLTYQDGVRRIVTLSGQACTKAGALHKRDQQRHNVYFQFGGTELDADTPEWVRLLVKECDRD